jgi:predicted metal-dependent HD superfamily phosphohydrolase
MFAARNDIPLTAEDECILWLHDVVNVPLATWNEVRSANFAESVFSSCEMDEKYSVDVSMVQEGILTTAHHMDTEINKTFWTIMDLDLCHFVWRLELFKAADEAVKNELTSVIPLEQYEKGRKDFFQHLLDRGFIYRNPDFKIRFEEQAIKNIKLLLL